MRLFTKGRKTGLSQASEEFLGNRSREGGKVTAGGLLHSWGKRLGD